MTSANFVLHVLFAFAQLHNLCGASILAPNVTTSFSSNTSSPKLPTPTSTGLNDLLAGALASALAGGGLGGAMGGGGNYAPPRAGAPAAMQPFGPAGARGTLWPGPPYGGPVITANIARVTGQGDPSIYSCYQSHLDYNSMSRSYITNASGTVVYSTKTVPTSTMVTMYSNTSIPTTTMCDGWPRVLGHTATPVTLTFTDAQMVTKSAVFPGPSPTCTIADTLCNNAYSAFDSSTFSYLSSTYFQFFAEKKTGLPPNIYFGTLAPPCTRISSCPSATPSVLCSLRASRATVFYWPTTNTGLCGRGASPKPTELVAAKPKTAVFKNATITSPSALVVLQSIAGASSTKATTSSHYNYEPMYLPCGHHVDATLAVAPESLSSLRPSFSPTYIDHSYTRWTTTQLPYSLDLADLNPGAVPWDAYAARMGCNPQAKEDHQCPKTILPDYAPSLVLPKEATALGVNDEFASCAPGVVDEAVYIPITATTVEVPSTTHYGAKVSVGPRFSQVEPAALRRIIQAEATDVPLEV